MLKFIIFVVMDNGFACVTTLSTTITISADIFFNNLINQLSNDIHSRVGI